MPAKRTVAVAASVSAALVASTSAFAVANGIFGRPPADRVGSYHVLEQQLAPANAVDPTTVTTPPTSAASTTAPDPTSTPRDDATPVVAPGSPVTGEPPDDTGDTPEPEPEPEHEAPSIAPPASTSPTTHSTASTVAPHERDDDGHETEPDDGRDRDD